MVRKDSSVIVRKATPRDVAPCVVLAAKASGRPAREWLVQPELRRRGVARALTEMRLAWIRRRATSAWFFTNAQNAASIELHRAFGFVEVTRAFSFPRVTFEGGVGILYRAMLVDE